MILTLYKNCILSNSYSEVFDVKPRIDPVTQQTYTIFERYLNTLTKTVIDLGDSVYATNSGVITIDNFQQNVYAEAYEFNYMKVVSEDQKFKRYCFITDITIGNGTASISYTEDIWHSYADSMHIRNSYLSQSRKLNYGNNIISNYELPINYNGNSTLGYLQVTDLTLDCYIIIQYQEYKLINSTTEKTGERKTYSAFLSTGSPNQNTIKFNLATVESLISKLVTRSSNELTTGIYYEIDNITVVPSNWDLFDSTKLSSATLIREITNIPASNDIFVYALPDAIYRDILFKGSIKLVKQETLTKADTLFDRTISIGTFTTQIGCFFNGLDIVYQIFVCATDYDFKILFSVQSQIRDITNDFVIKVPFTAVTGDITAQREIAQQTKVFNNAFQIANGTVDVVSGIAEIAVGASVGAEFSELAGIKGRGYTKGKAIRNEIASKQAYASGISGGGNTIMNGITNIATGINNIVNANKPQFTTTKGNFVNSNGLLNCFYGIIRMYILSQNDEMVENLIDNIGYKTYKILNDEVFDTLFTDYNVIKFDFVNIYGKFTQSICEALKYILLNGTKIWYDYTLGN